MVSNENRSGTHHQHNQTMLTVPDRFGPGFHEITGSVSITPQNGEKTGPSSLNFFTTSILFLVAADLKTIPIVSLQVDIEYG